MAVIKQNQLSNLVNRSDLMEIQKRFPLSFFPFNGITEITHSYTETYNAGTWTVNMHFNNDLVPTILESVIKGTETTLDEFMNSTDGFRGFMFLNNDKFIDPKTITIKMESYYSFDLTITGLIDQPTISNFKIYSIDRGLLLYKSYGTGEVVTNTIAKKLFNKLLFIQSGVPIKLIPDVDDGDNITFTYNANDTFIMYFKNLISTEFINNIQELNGTNYCICTNEYLENAYGCHYINLTTSFTNINSKLVEIGYIDATTGISLDDVILIFGFDNRELGTRDKLYKRDFPDTTNMITNGYPLYNYIQAVTNPKHLSDMSNSEMQDLIFSLYEYDIDFLQNKMDSLYGHNLINIDHTTLPLKSDNSDTGLDIETFSGNCRYMTMKIKDLTPPFIKGVFNLGDYIYEKDDTIYLYWLESNFTANDTIDLLIINKQPFNRQFEVFDNLLTYNDEPTNEELIFTIKTTSVDVSPNLKVFNYVNEKMYECKILNLYQIMDGYIEIIINGFKDNTKPFYVVANNNYKARIKVNTNFPYFDIDDYNTLTDRQELFLFQNKIGLTDPLIAVKKNRNYHGSNLIGSVVSMRSYQENGSYLLLDTNYRKLSNIGIIDIPKEEPAIGFDQVGYNIIDLPVDYPPYSPKYYLVFSNGKLINNIKTFNTHKVEVPRDANKIQIYTANIDFERYYIIYKNLLNNRYRTYFENLISSYPELTPYNKTSIVEDLQDSLIIENKEFPMETISIQKIIDSRTGTEISKLKTIDFEAASQTLSKRVLLSGARNKTSRFRTR